MVLLDIFILFTFNIAIFVGLVAGSVSSLVIGSKVWLLLERRSMNKPEEDDEDDVKEIRVKGVNY